MTTIEECSNSNENNEKIIMQNKMYEILEICNNNQNNFDLALKYINIITKNIDIDNIVIENLE